MPGRRPRVRTAASAQRERQPSHPRAAAPRAVATAIATGRPEFVPLGALVDSLSATAVGVVGAAAARLCVTVSLTTSVGALVTGARSETSSSTVPRVMPTPASPRPSMRPRSGIGILTGSASTGAAGATGSVVGSGAGAVVGSGARPGGGRLVVGAGLVGAGLVGATVGAGAGVGGGTVGAGPVGCGPVGCGSVGSGPVKVGFGGVGAGAVWLAPQTDATATPQPAAAGSARPRTSASSTSTVLSAGRRRAVWGRRTPAIVPHAVQGRGGAQTGS